MKDNNVVRTAVAIVSAATVLLGLSGCSTPADSSSHTLRIAFIPGITSDPFFRAMEVAAKDEAESLGVELVWQGSSSEYSAQTQLPFVDAALADGVDALILAPTDPDSLQSSVNKAAELGIPVVAVDTTVTDAGSLVSYITGDNEQGGKDAAQALAQKIGGKGEVLIMSGSPTDQTNTLREQGFRAELAANYPDVIVVDIQYAQSQPAKATSAVNAMLLAHPDIKGIFALDGSSGTGTIAALQNSGNVGKIALVGYDAYKNQVADLENGLFSALVAQNPAEMARLAVQYAVKAINGDTADIEKNVVIPTIVMTPENLAETKQYEYVE